MMAAARFCRFCLITDVKMDVVNTADLEYFNTLIEPSSQILACYECIATVGKIKTFLDKYMISQAVLGTILETQHQVSENDVKGINRKSLKLESNLKCENPLIISLDTQSEEHLASGDHYIKVGRGDVELEHEMVIGSSDDKANGDEDTEKFEASYVNSEITNKRQSARNNDKVIKPKYATVDRKKGPKRKLSEPTETVNSDTGGMKSYFEESKEEVKRQTVDPNEFSFLEEEITILDDEDDILYLEGNVEDVINSLHKATEQKGKIKNNPKQIKGQTDSKVESDGSKLERIKSHKRKLAKSKYADRRVLSKDCEEKEIENNLKMDNSNEFSFLEEEISIFDSEDDDDKKSDILYLDNVLEEGVDSLKIQITKSKNPLKSTRKSHLRPHKRKSNSTKPRLWEEFLDDAPNGHLAIRCSPPRRPSSTVNGVHLGNTK